MCWCSVFCNDDVDIDVDTEDTSTMCCDIFLLIDKDDYDDFKTHTHTLLLAKIFLHTHTLV